MSQCPFKTPWCIQHVDGGDGFLQFNPLNYFAEDFCIANEGVKIYYKNYSGEGWKQCDEKDATFCLRGTRDLCCRSIQKYPKRFAKGLPYPIIEGVSFKEFGNYVLWKNGALMSKKTRLFTKPRRAFKTLYWSYILAINGKRVSIGIHRLVWMVWGNNGEDLDPKIEVNHLDTNQKNNHYDNLQYISGTQNRAHSDVIIMWFSDFINRAAMKFRSPDALKTILGSIPEDDLKKMKCLGCGESTFEDGTITCCLKCIHIMRCFPWYKVDSSVRRIGRNELLDDINF